MASIQKYLKRVMAAEYSRELGVKCRAGQDRVVANGFQMGRIPCIGYRRVSVSADGQSRTPISNGHRKLTATDRIAWVLGPEHEVELVRRIFRLYAARAQTTWGIWKISQREGWTDAAGFPITRARITRLLHNEAVIGNFVWGRTHAGARMSSPAVSIGVVPRIVEDKTWALVQERLKNPKGRSRIAMIDDLRRALEQDPYLPQHLIRKAGCMDVARYREEFGSFPAALREAGADLRMRRAHARAVRAAKRKFTIAFGDGLGAALSDLGVPARFNGTFDRLLLRGLDAHVQVLWAREEDGTSVWEHVHRGRRGEADHVIALLYAGAPVGALLLTATEYDTLPATIRGAILSQLTENWCQSAAELTNRLRQLEQPHLSAALPVIVPSGERTMPTSRAKRRGRSAYRSSRAGKLAP